MLRAENLTVRTRVTIVADGDHGSVEICPRRGSVVVLVADAVMLTDLQSRTTADPGSIGRRFPRHPGGYPGALTVC